MARKRGESDNPVSLFPFLSILACVIGTLVLLITSLAISQIQSDPEEELMQRVQEYETLKQQQKAMNESLEQLRPKVHELEQYREALRKLEQLAEQLRRQKQEQLTQTDREQKEIQKILEQEKTLDAEISELEERAQTLDDLLARLRAELERRKRVLEAPTVRVVPGKGGEGMKPPEPVFVEVDGEGLILDPGDEKIRIPAAKMTTDAAFRAAIEDVAGDRSRALVFLIRSDGIDVYRAAQKFARSNNALVAKLPVVGDGMLDLSRF